MPLYDFKCPTCGLGFEVSRPMSRATEPVACPNDGSQSERVFTAPPVYVRGGGSRDSGPVESDATPSLGHDHGHSHGPGGHDHPH